MTIIGASTWAGYEAYIASHSINDLLSDALSATWASEELPDDILSASEYEYEYAVLDAADDIEV